jgi:CRP-like cAMP-binding protein
LNVIAAISPRKVERAVPWCDRCTLRSGCGSKDFTQEELSFMMDFKVSHGRAWAGETIIEEGEAQQRCYTLYSGWAIRYRPLPNGHRHILSILLPGDPLGLHGALCGTSSDVFEAVTDVTFCVFDGTKLRTALGVRGLAERIARLLACENLQLANRLAVTGGSSARASLSHLVLELYRRLAQRNMTHGHTFNLPLSLKQLADAVGLTPVHLHRVLKGLQEDGVLAIEHRTVCIMDFERLAACGLSLSLPSIEGSLL